jgi:hypothetical protein
MLDQENYKCIQRSLGVSFYFLIDVQISSNIQLKRPIQEQNHNAADMTGYKLIKHLIS